MKPDALPVCEALKSKAPSYCSLSCVTIDKRFGEAESEWRRGQEWNVTDAWGWNVELNTWICFAEQIHLPAPLSLSTCIGLIKLLQVVDLNVDVGCACVCVCVRVHISGAPPDTMHVQNGRAGISLSVKGWLHSDQWLFSSVTWRRLNDHSGEMDEGQEWRKKEVGEIEWK